jgi:hypothetical protein
MSQNNPALEKNLLALMRNHGSNKNRKNTSKTRKNEKKPSLKSRKSQKNLKSEKDKMKPSKLGSEYDRKAREWAKRPQYKGDQSKLVMVREPWDPRNDDEYYEREYFLDPKTGNYYDLDRIRLVARTRNGVIVPLKLIR